jgi:peroxiredoxin
MSRAQVFKSLASAAILIGLTSCAKEKPVMDFALKDSAGATVKLSDYRGKVVLLNFWATWCAPCKIEIPWFVEFQQQYKNREFAVLGVSMDEDGWDSVRPYMTAHKLNYPVVVGGDTIERMFGGVDDLPTTFLMDRNGHIAKKHVGLISKNAWEDEIGAMLKGGILRGAAQPVSPVLAFFEPAR